MPYVNMSKYEYLFIHSEKLMQAFEVSNQKQLSWVCLVVTASSGTAMSTDMLEILSKIRSNLTWHSNMLKTKYLPEKAPKKSRNRRSRRTSAGDDKKRRPQRIQNTVSCQSLGDIHYYSKGNQCSSCSPEYPCGILCGN